MKKKTLVTLLVTAMVCGSVVGCGKTTTPQPKEEPVVEASTETSVETEGTEDASATASTEEETVETTTENHEYTVERVANAINLNEGIVEISTYTDGIKMTMGMQGTTKDSDNSILYMEYEKEVNGTLNQSGLYGIGKDVYLYLGADDEKFVVYHTEDASGTYTSTEGTAKDATGLIIDTESIVEVNYRAKEHIEDNDYDVVEVIYKSDDATTTEIATEEATESTEEATTTSTEEVATEPTEEVTTTSTEEVATESQEGLETAIYYFNVTTGKVDYIDIENEGEQARLQLKYKESFEEPAWFADAETMESDDMTFVTMAMAVVVLPMSDEPLTKESLAEGMGNIDFNFDLNLDNITIEDSVTEDVSTEVGTN